MLPRGQNSPVGGGTVPDGATSLPSAALNLQSGHTSQAAVGSPQIRDTSQCGAQRVSSSKLPTETGPVPVPGTAHPNGPLTV